MRHVAIHNEFIESIQEEKVGGEAENETATKLNLKDK